MLASLLENRWRDTGKGYQRFASSTVALCVESPPILLSLHRPLTRPGYSRRSCSEHKEQAAWLCCRDERQKKDRGGFKGESKASKYRRQSENVRAGSIIKSLERAFPLFPLQISVSAVSLVYWVTFRCSAARKRQARQSGRRKYQRCGRLLGILTHMNRVACFVRKLKWASHARLHSVGNKQSTNSETDIKKNPKKQQRYLFILC